MLKIVCIKAGNKYNSEYVNKLYAMVARNIKSDFQFICITDDLLGISNAVHRIFTLFPHKGWWNKLTLFSDIYSIRGNILFLDLDIVITDKLDEVILWGEKQLDTGPAQLVIINDWWQKLYNSSVMMFRTGTLNYIYQSFLENQERAMKQNGDQNWITNCMKAHKVITWPEEWMISFRHHIEGTCNDQKHHELSKYPFAKIVVFHGNKKPHNVDEEFVRALWR